MTTIVYLNGDFLPVEQARVPVMDRGFLFGDGVYEVIPVYNRRPFRLEEHLARLDASLAGIRLTNPHDLAAWRSLTERVIAEAGQDDLGLYIQVTRGVGARDHAFPARIQPTVFILPMPLSPPAPGLVATGVGAITAVDNRWLRCDLKTISLLPNVLLRQLSVDAGSAETILIRDGFLTEGSASSVFVVMDGVIVAPPKSERMLPGITYDVVFELAEAHGMACARRPVPERELRAAAEIWLTSSTKEILAVTRLDGQAVGDGRPGALFARIHTLYQAYKHTVMRGNEPS